MDRMYCQEQLLRLSGLPGYPKTDDGKRSLIDAFQGAFGFAGPERLRKWIDDVLRHCDKCPLPKDAYQRGREMAPEKPVAKTRCFVCYDSGIMYAEFLETWSGGHAKRERLTPEQAAVIWTKHREAEKRGDRTCMLLAGQQMIFELPVACACKEQATPRMPPPPNTREWVA